MPQAATRIKKRSSQRLGACMVTLRVAGEIDDDTTGQMRVFVVRTFVHVLPIIAVGCHLGGIRSLDASTGASDASTGERLNGEGPSMDFSCQSTLDCRMKGHALPYLCLKGSCSDLRTQHCPILVGPDTPPFERFVVGAISRLDVEKDERAIPVFANLDLAVREIATFAMPVRDMERRPLVLLCHAADGDVAVLEKVLDELALARVPGVMMMTNAIDVRRAFDYSQTKGTPILFLHSGGPDDLLRDTDDDGLVWHLGGDPRQLAPAYVALVERVERLVNPGTGSPTRLTMVVDPTNTFAADTAAVLGETLRINGAPVAGQAGTNFNQLTIALAVPEFIDRIAQLQPHILLLLTSDNFVVPLIEGIEQASVERPIDPPFYVLSPDATHLPELPRAAFQHPGLRTRIAGIDFEGPRDRDVLDGYLDRLPPLPEPEGLGRYYDMVYFLLYAAAAADETGAFDGKNLAAGLLRLVDPLGPRFDVGPVEVGDVLIRLSDKTATLRLHGVLGPADFDLKTGTPHAGGSVWCIDEYNHYRYDALRLAETGQLEGAFGCYPF
jgi:hypothetical protein